MFEYIYFVCIFASALLFFYYILKILRRRAIGGIRIRRIVNHLWNNFNLYAIILLFIYLIACISFKKPVLDDYGRIVKHEKIVRIGNQEYVKLSVYKEDIYQIHTNHDKKIREKEKEVLEILSKQEAELTKEHHDKIERLKQDIIDQRHENLRLIRLNEKLIVDNQTNYNKFHDAQWQLYEQQEECEDDTLECEEYNRYLQLFNEDMTEEEREEERMRDYEHMRKIYVKNMVLGYYITLFVLTLFITHSPPFYLLQKLVVSHHLSNSSAMHVTTISKYRQVILVVLESLFFIILYLAPICITNIITFKMIIGGALAISVNTVYLIYVYVKKYHFVNYINSHTKYRVYVNKKKNKVMIMNPSYVAMPPQLGISFDNRCNLIISKIQHGVRQQDMKKMVDDILSITIDSISLVARQFSLLHNIHNPVCQLDDHNQTITINDYQHAIGQLVAPNTAEQNMQRLIVLQRLMKHNLQRNQHYLFVANYLRMLAIIAHVQDVGDQMGNAYAQYCCRFEDNILLKKKMTQNVISKQDFYYYNFSTNRFNLSTHYRITEMINMFYVPVSNDNALIQVYSAGKSFLKQKNQKMKNLKLRITGHNSKAIIDYLMKINSNIQYTPGDEHKSHDLSHWISKVLHITDINNLMDEVTDTKILDVGSSLSDPVLGHGVYYNVSQEEEMDYKRMNDMASRLKTYVEYDRTKDSNIVIYYGDITTFDMTRTDVCNLYMHNCVYNIDLGKMLTNAKFNDYSQIVTQTQLSQNVVEGVECENEINQMVYQFHDAYNESTLSECNYQIEGITEGAVYTHDGAVTMDWFKINSVKMGDEYWNKTIDNADMGYYKQTWYPSKKGKGKGREYLQENENSMDCIVIKHEASYCSVYYTTRPKNASIRDTSIATRDYATQRDENNVGVLRNIISGETDIKALTCNTWDELTEIDLTKNGVYYKVMRQGIEQKQTELTTNITRHENWKPVRMTFDRNISLCLSTIIDSLVRNDYQTFDKHISKCIRNKIQIYVKQSENIYSIGQNKYSYKKQMLIIEKDKFYIGKMKEHVFDEKEVKCVGSEYVYNILQMTQLHDDDARYRDKYKMLDNLEMNEIKQKVMNGSLHQVEKLEIMMEREHEINEDDRIVKSKQKIYALSANVEFSSKEDTQNALLTGSLKHSYVTHFITVDIEKRKIHDPFNYLSQYMRHAPNGPPRPALIGVMRHYTNSQTYVYRNVVRSEELLAGAADTPFTADHENGMLIILDHGKKIFCHIDHINKFKIDRTYHITH